jgi:hypothetical protein
LLAAFCVPRVKCSRYHWVPPSRNPSPPPATALRKVVREFAPCGMPTWLQAESSNDGAANVVESWPFR